MKGGTNVYGKPAAAFVDPIRYRDFEDPSANSRPPDAAIRANVQIIKEVAAGMGALIRAGHARPALNLVVAGNTSSEARPPEKVSDLNAGLLAGAGALAAAGASSQKSAETDAKVEAKDGNTSEPEKKAEPENNEPTDPVTATPKEKSQAKAKTKPEGKPEKKEPEKAAPKQADEPADEKSKGTGGGAAVAASAEGLAWLISLAKNFF